MGGYSFPLDIEPLPDVAQGDVDELAYDLMRSIVNSVWNISTSGIYGGILNGYVSNDGFREEASTSEITLSFSEAAGMCAVSCAAMSHWTKLMLDRHIENLTEICATRGYRLKSTHVPPSTQQLILPSFPPIVHVKRKPCNVFLSRGQYVVFADNEQIEYAQLKPADQLLVEEACLAHRCACTICTWCRKWLPKPMGRDSPKGAIRAAWQRVQENGTAYELAPVALQESMALTGTAWEQTPLGPPSLGAFLKWLEDQGTPLAVHEALGLARTMREEPSAIRGG